MKLPSSIRFADPKIKEAFYKLEKGDDSERELFKFINQALDNIKKMHFVALGYQKSSFLKNIIRNTKFRIYGNMICQRDGD